MGCEFEQRDVLQMNIDTIKFFNVDFICASSPCGEFSVHGMKHFHPNPKHPEMGIALFNHTRSICEASGVPYVMENVRAAQQFVGNAVHHCGSFYLWGNAVSPILPQGISKGYSQMRRDGRYPSRAGIDHLMYMDKKIRAAALATIHSELASCIAEYAEQLIGMKVLA